MIRRGTWLAIIVLLALVGFSYVLRDRQSRAAATATPTQGLSPLFEDRLGNPSAIRLEGATGQVVAFSRNADGIWVLDAPEKAEADQAAAQAAATQVDALRVLSTVDLDPQIIGLDAPAYTLTVEFDGGSIHSLRLGSVTPITDGYYAQLDQGPFQVVDKYGVDKLIELLGTPPFLATPEPAVTSSAVPATTTGSGLTPEAGPTAAAPAASAEPTAATGTP